MNQIRSVLEANRKFTTEGGGLSHAERAKAIAIFAKYNADLPPFIECMTDGELVTLISLVSGLDTEREATTAVFAFMVGYHLRHENTIIAMEGR